jgi:hypothetical protein
MWRAAVRLNAGVAVATALTFLILACGGGIERNPASSSAVIATRTVTVNVALKNRINNAVESDVTILITIGKVPFTVKGSTTAWVNTTTDVLTSTRYTVAAVGTPEDYVTNTCSGDLSEDVTCTITLTDTLAPPGCDAALIKFLYRPARFEGLLNDGTPIPRCETTWGIVRGSESEHDGDAESWIQPIKSEASRLFSAAHGNFNASRNHWVVGEWICRVDVTPINHSEGMVHCDEYRKYVARGYFQEVSMPGIGDSGVFFGFLVYDCGHGCWTELHPLVWWHKLVHPLTPDLF